MMGAITELFAKKVQPVSASQSLSTVPLEHVIEELEVFGCPQIGKFKDGTWSVMCELNGNHQGLSGVIRSEFRHPSPISAALQCLDRCKAAFGGSA